MIVLLHAEAEQDLADAFDFYESQLAGLGREFVFEFRRGVDKLNMRPRAWQPLDDEYRQFRLDRFPYGVIYRIDDAAGEILIVAVSPLPRKPGWWRGRDR